MKLPYNIFLTSCWCMVVLLTSCDDFIKIDPPRTDLVRSTVFANDATANAAVSDIYAQLKNDGFASGSPSSLSLLAALSSDEMLQYGQRNTDQYLQFNENTLQSTNPMLASLWSNIYLVIYKTNSVIEGLAASPGVTQQMGQQLTGEAKFIRALSFFYAVNLWGDVPLTLTPDYKTNNSIARSPVADVYAQIVADLTDAQSLLKDDFSASKGQRVRANAGAASALLARVFLYLEDWQNAETQASKVIANSATYSLASDLTTVFGTSSKEAIFQLWSNQYPRDYITFVATPVLGPAYAVLPGGFANTFEIGDNRVPAWTTTINFQGTSYFSSRKYIAFAVAPVDYSTVLRLAEQYLIRAEARAHLGKLPEASADLNAIRNRSGLSNTSAATQSDLLDAIIGERRVELFAEFGHRWFDLKRIHKADAMLSVIKTDWTASDALYPIPEAQIISDPAITQNPK
jgi:hypothetical protein